MKVLIFSHEYPPLGGGAGVVGYQLVRHLCDDPLFNKVDLLTRSSLEYPHEPRLNEFFQVPIHNKIWPLEYIAFINLKLDLNTYDLIICNDSLSIYIAGCVFSKNILSKTICFLHGSEPEFVYEHSSLYKKLLFLRFFFHRAMKYCKCIGAHSHFMKEKIQEVLIGKFFIADSKIIPVYFGYDGLVFNSQGKIDNRAFIRDLYKINEDEILLLTVSRIERKKGFEAMLQSFMVMKEKNINVKWLIVGDGSYVDDMKKIVLNNSLESNVVFTGKIKRNELTAYYHAADVFWLLSEYDEAFGLVYMEAQASGLPAIGYNRAGVVEAISNKRSGFLINSPSEVIDIIDKEKFREISASDLSYFSQEFASNKCYENIRNKLFN